MTNAFILGLDCSSSSVGFCLYNGTVLDRGVIRLDPKAWIGARCVAARDALSAILDQYAVDLVAVEAPVVRFGSCIPQIRVSGVLLELAERRGILAVEVTPTAAKLALADDGAATKREMLAAAALWFGWDANMLLYECYHGEWIAVAAARVYGEHEADALGCALAAVGKVEVVEV